MNRARGYFWKFGGCKTCDRSIIDYCRNRNIDVVEIPYDISAQSIYDVWAKVIKYVADDIKTHQPKLCFTSNHCLNVAVMSPFMDKYNNIIYIDAHADCNTPETSPTGNIHGMGLAALCNKGDERVVSSIPSYCKSIQGIAIRDTDAFELQNVKELRLCTFDDIDYTQKSCVSFDVDALSPEYYTSCHLNVSNGLKPEVLRDFFAKINLDNIGIIEVSEINQLSAQDEKTLDFMFEPLFKQLNQ